MRDAFDFDGDAIAKAIDFEFSILGQDVFVDNTRDRKLPPGLFDDVLEDPPAVVGVIAALNFDFRRDDPASDLPALGLSMTTSADLTAPSLSVTE